MKARCIGLVFLATPLVMSACSSAEHTLPVAQQAEAPRAIGSIIVKPLKPVTDDATLMKLVSVHLTTPEQVKFLRSMSGGAYVLNVIPPATKADIPKFIAQLTASGVFEYVEEDQVMTIQR